jgi:hypothetical protein
MDGMTRDYADHRRLERARGRGRASARRDVDEDDDAKDDVTGRRRR